MTIKFKYNIEVHPLTQYNPFREDGMEYEVYISGEDEVSHFEDLYICKGEDVENLIEFINSNKFKPTDGVKIW